jgi:enoyl-CoA hydratase/carnithine racemase
MTHGAGIDSARQEGEAPSAFTKIRYEVADAVAFITLNRPKVLNALDPDVYRELTQASALALGDPSVNAILLAGEGKSFCSGWDLSQSVDEPEPTLWGQWLGLQGRHKLRQTFWYAAKPVLSAVQGFCLGAGYELAHQADLVIAADDAIFCEPEIRYSWVSHPMTVWLIGLRRAKEKLMFGDRFDAAEAYRIGLVNWVVPREQLAAESRRLAVKLARMPTETMQLTKRTLNRALDIQGFKASSDWGNDTFLLSQQIVTERKKEFVRIAEEQGVKAALQWLDKFYEGL